ncbi:hypothetical protein WJX79_001319 [Trebouxia sp. C0005]
MSELQEDGPPQCTANLDQGEATHPAVSQAGSAIAKSAHFAEHGLNSISQRSLLASRSRPAPTLTSVLHSIIPKRSFLQVPEPYAPAEAPATSGPSTPSPSSGLQTPSPYASPSPSSLVAPSPPPITLVSSPTATSDIQSAVATAVSPLAVTTTALDVGSGSWNVTIVFPANNQVSSSASQGTLAATNFVAALKSDPATALPGLVTAVASFTDLATTLYTNSDKALYNVTAYNGPVNISNVVYGSMLVPAAAPAPAPGPSMMPEAAPEAAAAPESAGAAIESYSGTEQDGDAVPSGQLYAINMQYGVGGATTNSSANLLVFSLNTSVTPRATDFTVQLSSTSQTGNVSVLSTYSSSSDYLVRVDSPVGYVGPVTVDYASPTVQAVSYNVVDSLLLVKITASTATQQ